MAESTHLLGLPLKHKLNAKHIADIMLSNLTDQQLLSYELASKKWRNVSTIPDSAYPNALLLDGTRAMTAPLPIVDVYLKRISPVALAIYQSDLTTLASLRIYGLDTEGAYKFPELIGKVTNSVIRTLATETTIDLKAQDELGSLVICAQLIASNGWDPIHRFDIPRLGDASLLSGRTLNSLNGIFRLPDSAPASPSANDCYFDASTNTLYVYNGTVWVSTVLS